MKKYLWLAGFDGANSFFSLFYAFEYWWSSDTVGNDLIGGRGKTKAGENAGFCLDQRSL